MKFTMKWWLALAALLAVIAALLYVFLRPTEPTYQGTSLNEWLGKLDSTTVFDAHGELTATNHAAAAALRAMGTNSLPLLLERLRMKRPEANSAPGNAFARPDPVKNPTDADLLERCDQALAAFAMLGPIAAPAVPQLVALLQESNYTSVATIALAGIGPAAHPALLQALNHTNGELQVSVALRIGFYQEKAAFAVPTLIALLSNQSTNVRVQAAYALGQIKSLPDQTIPALIKALADPDPYVNDLAATALSQFGTNAAAALPALQQLLTRPNQETFRKKLLGLAIQRITDTGKAARP
ncbi:MAG: HEAT repeat domain-containing protein [Verrucomicrobiota bacterium]